MAYGNDTKGTAAFGSTSATDDPQTTPQPANTDLQYRIAESQGNWPRVNQREEIVSTSGTAKQLNDGKSLQVPDGAQIRIKALGDNSGNVYIGDSDVTTSNGFELGQGDTLQLQTTDVANVFVDADNDNDGICWFMEVA